MQIPVNFEIDDNGYLDRQCPSAECGGHFKILYEDWVAIVSDEVVYCPRCRHEEVAMEWNTPEQLEHIRGTALNYTRRRIWRRATTAALGRLLPSNPQQFYLHAYVLPAWPCVRPPTSECRGGDDARVSMRWLRLQIHIDRCRFLLPCLRRTSILESFANAMETVKNTMASLPTVQRAIEADWVRMPPQI